MKSVKESMDEKLGGVNLRNVNASWVESQIVPTLSNITFELKPGQLCAIIGSVGSGKSSILQLLLKELSINRGTLDIHGKVSFCSQEPWLFQGSVRNNILFGLPFDDIRYRRVVNVCALNKDFEQVQIVIKLILMNFMENYYHGSFSLFNLKIYFKLLVST